MGIKWGEIMGKMQAGRSGMMGVLKKVVKHRHLNDG